MTTIIVLPTHTHVYINIYIYIYVYQIIYTTNTKVCIPKTQILEDWSHKMVLVNPRQSQQVKWLLGFGHIFTPAKTNTDTQNDSLENLSPLLNIKAIFGIS